MMGNISADQQPATIQRRAGHNEHRTIIRDALDLYGCVIIAAVYRIAYTSEQNLRSHLLHALASCIQQHPVLSTVPVDFDTEKPKYARPPIIKLDDHLVLSSEKAPDSSGKSLEAVLAAVHNTPVHTRFSCPPWKLHVQTIADNTDTVFIAFAFSHVVGDGMGGLAFHHTLLTRLTDPPSTSPPTDIRTANLPPLLPAMETAGHFSISPSFLLAPLLGVYLPKPLAKLLNLRAAATPDSPPNMWAGRDRTVPGAAAGEIKTSIIVHTVAAATLSDVLSRCHQQSSPGKEVRLTALLQQLIARSVKSALTTRGKADSALVGSIALDMRRALGGAITTSDIANCTSGIYDVFLPTDPTFQSTEGLWDAARRETALLAARAATLKDQAIGLLKFLSNFRTWMLSNVTKAADCSFAQSNLGAFKPGVENKVEKIAFSQSADPTSAPLALNIVSLAGGELIMTATWRPSWLDVEDEEAFVRDVCTGVEAGLADIAAERL